MKPIVKCAHTRLRCKPSFLLVLSGVGRSSSVWYLVSALLFVVGFNWTIAARAQSLRYCDAPAALTVAQQDKLLRFSELIKSQLTSSNHSVALISRSGLDLSRFNLRYSHSGLSVLQSANGPWSVRQLYYACEDRTPKIFDQGMAGFVMGTNSPQLGFVSVVLLPADANVQLEAAALDNPLALNFLGSKYSANAYAFSQIYQNCNQWLIELLASAFARIDPQAKPAKTRSDAQAWLISNQYNPTEIAVGNPILMMLGAFVSHIHNDDHPPENISQMKYRLSMPQSIEDFVRQRFAGAQRIEFCHNHDHMVVHKGWSPIAHECVPVEGDLVVSNKD